ncbi:MAG: amino acid racemase [Bacteroidota bacterium]
MVNAAQSLEKSGADCVLLCANTMHMFDQLVANSVSIPLIHIATATIKRINEHLLHKMGLLGTKVTMEMDFYKKRYFDSGLEIMIPMENDRTRVNAIIFNELFKGKINTDSKAFLIEIIEKFRNAGADGVILGCTELPLIIHQQDTTLHVFDTTAIHAEAAVDFALFA